MPDAYILTLHTLTLRQLANAAQLSEIIAQEPADVETSLEKGVADGAVMTARGSYMITPAGRQSLDDAYPEWFSAQRADTGVNEAMDRFEASVNKQVLKTMTDWQTVEIGGERQTNDHSDADYDARIIDKLATLLDKTEKVLEPIAAAEPHISRFLVRIAAALTRAESGETEYISGARVDSFHTIWFQMHEHLLRMLERERPE